MSADNQDSPRTTTSDPELPPETIEFATRMFDAARGGNSELLLAAVDAGLPVNLSNQKGNTLLILAAYGGHTELVRGLLQRGADPDRLNDRGQSAIAGAVFKRGDDIVRVLREAGADPRAGMPNAIAIAQMFKRTELLDVLGAEEGEGVFHPPTA